MTTFLLATYLSPTLLTPLSLSGNAITTWRRPEAVLMSPQLLGLSPSFEASVSRDFDGLIKRSYLGVQAFGLGLAWYSLAADPFYHNLLALGYGYHGFGANLIYEPEDTVHPVRGGLGAFRVFYPLWVSIYAGAGDRAFGLLSLRYPSPYFDFYLDLLQEKGYHLAIKSGFSFTLGGLICGMGYDNASSSFTGLVGVSWGVARVSYGYRSHPVLGSSHTVSINLRRGER